MTTYRRVLVISNNGFSETSSNGRTLGNFFWGWPKDKLAQFCISMATPNYDLCSNYYIVTDKSALSAFKHFKKAERVAIEDSFNTEGTTSLKKSGKRSRKTAGKALLRGVVWGNKRWKSREYEAWINDFDPEVVLVVMSDSNFIHNIALDVVAERSIPLVMFCTEGFYLFKHNHMRVESILDRIAYPIYKTLYKRKYDLLMRKVSHVIYCNDKLEEDYQKVFIHNSSVLYTSSQLPFDESDPDVNNPVFSYLGNFGFNRPLALIEIAETLQKINSQYKLDVYGKIEFDSVRQLFEGCSAISLKGFIPYSEVRSVISGSTILFHGESQEQKFQEGLRYGFTTKIADSISSGRCFVMYSSPDIAGAKYVIDTGAAWFAETREQLEVVIRDILRDSNARMQKRIMAKKMAIKNHNFNTNRLRFQDIINNCL